MSDKSIRISHPKKIKFNKIQSNGKYELEDGSLKSFEEISPTPSTSVINLEFQNEEFFNCIQFDSSNKDSEFMPNTFRIEISDDGKIWEPIIKEFEYSKVNRKQYKWNFSMIKASFVKLVMKFNKKDNFGKYKLALSNFKVLIAGIEKISASSENDRLWVKENIIDGRNDYGWSSKESDIESEEFLLLDLGSINRVEEIRILSKDNEETNFPEQFYFFYSEDDLSWHQLHEEPYFMTEQSTWYKWKFFPTNIRFFKLICINKKSNLEKKFVSQIMEIEIYADSDISAFSKKRIVSQSTPYSSIMRPGLVRLASDGDSKEGLAVQGNDRRLRDATTDFKGIVELASDGEEKDGVAVQGSDKRLKPSTESSYGLVRLAKNNEVKKFLVIQSDDDRLRDASTDYKGIVELAEDGETRPGVVVQASDKRLKKATTKDFGLVIIADHNEDMVNKVVAADDPRIKKATTEKEGILKFAKNGEDADFVAVQGSDKRLKIATTETKGIVELAQSGEVKEGVVVQGSDKRLKYASEEEAGIVSFAKQGLNTPLKAVQSDDPRLSDKREALPHNHDYALLSHDFNSHTGNINLQGQASSAYKNISPPLFTHSLIFAKNISEGGSGISGVGVDEGVVGFAEDFGVAGFSNGINQDSAGVAGFSKNGAGGFFISQKNFAIIANGESITRKDINGSGKAIQAIGDSEFIGNISLQEKNGNHTIAKYFPISNNENILKGDILVINDKDGTVSKSRYSYSNKVIGVCVENTALLLDKNEGKGFVLVALFGVTKINTDSSEGKISYGDLLVTGLTAGHGVKADGNKIKPGMLVAKALEESKKDKSQILALISLG